ncbi:MAG: hypothetical protein R6U85_00760 [Salinivirgaceae bacterium]
MTKILAILLVSNLLFFGCKSESNSNKSDNIDQKPDKYEIEILYNYHLTDSSNFREYLDDKYLRNGNIFLFFEASFHDDLIDIKIDDKNFFSDCISTDSSTGLAEMIEINDIDNVDRIDISVNNGKSALIKVDTMNVFLVNYKDSKLTIKVPKHVPFYD